jgi:hypothetical protein
MATIRPAIIFTKNTQMHFDLDLLEVQVFILFHPRHYLQLSTFAKVIEPKTTELLV